MPRKKNEKGGRQPGNSKQLSTKLPNSDRNPLQREQDRARIAELHNQDMTDAEIARVISSERPYAISRRTVTNDRNAVLDKLHDTQLAEVQEKINRELANINKIEEAAWEAFWESKQDKTTIEEEVYTSARKDENYERLKKITTPGSASSQHLAILLRCSDQRAKLEGLYKLNINIEKTERHEHHVRFYDGWSPSNWDNSEQIEEGEYE